MDDREMRYKAFLAVKETAEKSGENLNEDQLIERAEKLVGYIDKGQSKQPPQNPQPDVEKIERVR